MNRYDRMLRTSASSPKLRSYLRNLIANLVQEARFEKGKPADPTENMSEEDAKKWEEMNEKYKDEFK